MTNTIVDHKRGEVNELRQLLKNPALQRNTHKQRDILKKIVTYITVGVDVSDVYTEMILCASTRDIINKKMIYLYLSFYARTKHSLSILLINTLYKDINDYDPMIRGLALRTLCSLNLPNTGEYIHWILPKIRDGLRDNNFYVKKTAIISVAKLVRIDSTAVQPGGVADEMIDMLVGMFDSEQNEYVIICIIYTLNDVYHTLNTGQSFTITTTQCLSLLRRVDELNEWNQCTVLAFVARVKCDNDEQVFDILNTLEHKLLANSAAIQIATLNVFLTITRTLPDTVIDSVYTRIAAPLITLANCGVNEIAYIVLTYLHILAQQKPHLYSPYYTSFYLRDNDTTAIKKLKVQILMLSCDEHNYGNILSELAWYVNEADVFVSLTVIDSIGHICGRHSRNASLVNECVDHVASFLEQTNTDIINKTVQTIQRMVQHSHIDIQSTDLLNTTITTCVYYNDKLDDNAAVCLVWLLSRHAEVLTDAPYLIEALYIQPWIKRARTYSDTVQHAILNATMYTFFKRPAETQSMLGVLLNCAVNDMVDGVVVSHSVRDTTTLYYKLLQHDVNKAKSLFTDPSADKHSNGVSTTNDTASNTAWLYQPDIFNTLCAVYNLPADKFVKPINEFSESIDTTDEAAQATDTVDSIVEPILPVGDTDEQSPGSQQTSQTTAGTAQPIDLFSLDSLNAVDAASTLQLQPNPAIDKTTYQSKWQSLTTAHTLDHKLQTPSVTATQIEAVLQQQHINTFASGTPNNTIKLYLYSRDLSGALYLVECVVQQGGVLQAVFKTESVGVQPYVQVFQQAIEAL